MSILKRIICLLCVGAVLLLLPACGRRVNTLAGRLYYTHNEAGCTRIEWTDVDGLERHHVLGVIPQRDEMGEHQSKEAEDEELACNSKYVSSPCVSPDGRHMLCLFNRCKSICLYNLVDKKQEATIKGDSFYLRPCFVGDTMDFLYCSGGEDKRMSLYLYREGKSKLLYKARRLSAPSWCSMENKVYFTDILPDGYVVLKKMGLEADEPTPVMEYVSDPSFPPIGIQFAAVFQGTLRIFETLSKDSHMITAEPGALCPCWNPRSNEIAYVFQNQIFRIVDGEEEVKVELPRVKVEDVWWAKDIEK